MALVTILKQYSPAIFQNVLVCLFLLSKLPEIMKNLVSIRFYIIGHVAAAPGPLACPSRSEHSL